MRDTLFELIHEWMKHDESAFYLTADMGGGSFAPLQAIFPDRVLNVGIAEQNLIGVAAGLSNVGYRPICYTKSCFLGIRALDQIKNNICYAGYPVVLVGAGTGYDDGIAGVPHIALEDIGCMGVIPNMGIYSPSTKEGVKMCFLDILMRKTPAYIRIGGNTCDIGIIKIVEKCSYFMVEALDKKTLIITYGGALEYVMMASKQCNEFSVLILEYFSLDEINGLVEILSEYKNIIVVEEQYAMQGMYGRLCRVLVENKKTDLNMISLAPAFEYKKLCGDRYYFAEVGGYSANKIVEAVQKI